LYRLSVSTINNSASLKPNKAECEVLATIQLSVFRNIPALLLFQFMTSLQAYMQYADGMDLSKRFL